MKISLTDIEISEEEAEAILEEIALDPGGWGPSLAYYGPTSRSVLVSGEIDSESADSICGQLHVLERQSKEAPILVYINTPGGDVVPALAIYDVMRTIKCPVITVVQGRAYSAGLFILQGGDLRLAFPNSRFFYHEPISDGVVESVEQLQELADIYEWSRSRMNTIIRKRSGISDKKWKKYFTKRKTCANFTTEEALHVGLIDDTIEYSKKNPLPKELTIG